MSTLSDSTAATPLTVLQRLLRVCWFRERIRGILGIRVAMGAPSYRECLALRARNREKVSKRSSRASLPRVAKKCSKSQKSLEKVPNRDFFETPSTFSGLLLALRAERPGKTFLRFFRDFCPGGPDTPCNWALQSQDQRGFVFCTRQQAPTGSATLRCWRMAKGGGTKGGI